MRAVQFFLIIAIGLLISACGKGDENRVCTQSDFIGTFEGSTACANSGIGDAVVIVTAGSTDSELILNLDGATVTVEIDGCEFSGTVQDSNADLVYSGELRGDKIEVNLKGLVFMRPFDCTATANRQ